MTRRPASLAIGGAMTALLAALALTSLVWTPYPPEAMDVAPALAAPTAAHPFGADAYGRDVLSMLMAGAREALGVAVSAALLGAGLGAPLGLLAAARGGALSEALLRAGDVIFAFPALLVAVLLAAGFGPGPGDAIAAIGLFNTPVFLRVTRAAALKVWTRDFVRAARVAGRGDLAISLAHVAPNVIDGLIVQLAIQLSLAVVADAALSYVGLGAQPPAPSWGRMLAEAQTLYLQAPWLAVFPGGAVAFAVLAFTLLGDGLRRLLDPRR